MEPFPHGARGLSRWMVTLAVTMVFGFGGMIATMLSLRRH
jgi:hypothetical protein